MQMSWPENGLEIGKMMTVENVVKPKSRMVARGFDQTHNVPFS